MHLAGTPAMAIEIGCTKASSVDISPFPGLETARPVRRRRRREKAHFCHIGFANDRAGRGLSKTSGLIP
jgi:hypothetical protein